MKTLIAALALLVTAGPAAAAQYPQQYQRPADAGSLEYRRYQQDQYYQPRYRPYYRYQYCDCQPYYYPSVPADKVNFGTAGCNGIACYP